tara:strand:- start:66 stop:851 length:786 start_codon:yes stop_codon:yes gene_type:complete
MFKLIYLNGCSFVKRLDNSIVKTEFDIKKIINNASSGCSNDKIRRTTIDFLLKNKNLWEDLLVVIGWTQFTRFELVDEFKIMDEKSSSSFIQLNSKLVHNKEGSTNFLKQMDSSQSFINSKKSLLRFGQKKDTYGNDMSDKFWKWFMIRHYNVRDRYDKYLDNILYLQMFLKTNNIKYVMFDSLWSINETKLSDKYKFKYNEIDFDRWVWGDDKTSWSEYLTNIDPSHTETRVSNIDDHPNKNGQKIWLKIISNKVKELYE